MQDSPNIPPGSGLPAPGGAAKPHNGPAFLGGFELKREIGRGGMGTVYEAWQESLKRTVALKVLGGQVGSSQSAVVRFKREAQAAAKLHHDHIVSIFGPGEENGQYYYAMALIDGPGLNTIIAATQAARANGDRQGLAETVMLPRTGARSGITSRLSDDTSATATLPPRGGSPEISPGAGTTDFTHRDYFCNAAHHIATIADALDYAHREGVIHRDIKPHNLILGSNGKLMISDFGLARLAEQPGVTMTGELIGSPLYMPPEQLTGKSKTADHRIDIYSLGATLYEWLTLTPPYPGETREQVISKILTTEPPPLSVNNPAIPADLETICLKAIERDPRRRYRTAGELRDDLLRFLDHRPIKARRAGLPMRMGKFMRRHQMLSLAGGAAMVAVVLGLALFSKGREVKTQTAAAELAQGDVEQLKAENRQLLEDFRRLIPLEIGAPISMAEAAVPLWQGLVGGTAGSDGADEADKDGADPATVGTPGGIGRRLARDVYATVASPNWVEATPGLAPAQAEQLRAATKAWDEPDEAAGQIESYLAEHPNHEGAQRFHAALMGRLGRSAALYEDATAMVARKPSEMEGYFWWGLAQLLAGDAHGCLTTLDHWTGPGTLSMWLSTLRGLAFMADEQAFDAISSFDEALELDRDLIAALLGRSFAQATLGNVDGAITDLTQALELEPNNADMLALRGDRYAEVADFQAAARDYNSAMNIAGRTPAMVIRYLFALSQNPKAAPGSEAPTTKTPILGGEPSSSGRNPSAASLGKRLVEEVRPQPLDSQTAAGEWTLATRLRRMCRLVIP